MSRATITIKSTDVHLTRSGDSTVIDYPEDKIGTTMFGTQASPGVIGQQSDAPSTGVLDALIKTGWDFKNHGDGLLYSPDGTLLSKPEPTDPLPAEVKHDDTHDGVGALQQYKADHPWFHNGIDVDGNGSLVSFPGDTEPHARYSSNQKPGYLVLESGIVPPAAPMVTPIPLPDEKDSTIDFAWPEKQVLLRADNLSKQTITFRTKVPANWKPAKAFPQGMASISEVPGQTTAFRDLRVVIGGHMLQDFDGHGGISPTVSFPAPQPGDEVLVSIRNPEGVLSAALFDFGVPGR